MRIRNQIDLSLTNYATFIRHSQLGALRAGVASLHCPPRDIDPGPDPAVSYTLRQTLKILLIQPPTGIFNQSSAMIRAIPLPNLAESLTGRPPHDHVDLGHTGQLLQVGGRELGQIPTEDVVGVGEVGAIDIHRLGIEIDGGLHVPAGAMQPEREAPATGEEVEAGHLSLRSAVLHPSPRHRLNTLSSRV
jgi:hypothetical protein